MGKVKENFIETLERFVNNLPLENSTTDYTNKVISYTREYYKKDKNGNSHYYYNFYKVDRHSARIININYNIHTLLEYFGSTGFNANNGKFTGYDTKGQDVEAYLNKLIKEVLNKDDITINLYQI